VASDPREAGAAGVTSAEGGSGGVAGDGPPANSGAAGGGACSLDCERGTECVTRQSEPACEFPTQNAWLALESSDASSVHAVRLEKDGASAPDVLNTFAPGRYLNFMEWSPSGRYLLLHEAWLDNPYDTFRGNDRWLWAYFGAGLPTRAEPLPNLPNSGHYSLPQWDTGTAAMLLRNGSESYIVRFDGSRAKAEVAVTSDESYELWLCRGANALIYGSDQYYVVPVGATSDTERVPLGMYPSQSSDLAKIIGVRPGTTRGREALFVVDCRAGAIPEDLLEIDGTFASYRFWQDDRSLLLVKNQDDRTLLELVPLDHPDVPFFTGEFTNAMPSWDGSLVLLESALPGTRYYVAAFGGGEPEAVAIDGDVQVAWCGQRLLLESRNPETGMTRTQVLDARNWSEPRWLIPESGDELSTRICDSSGEWIAYVRYTASEQRLELVQLAAPDAPPLIYPLGPRIYVQIVSFHADERGLLAALAGPEERVFWLPFPNGAPAVGRELSGSRYPTLQPRP